MKVGLSTYSLLPALKSGEMTVLDVVDWIAAHGGEHMEIVPYGFSLIDDMELADAVADKAASVGIELSNYAMPANFVQETEEAFQDEVNRLKKHVDLIQRMGIKHMRHDVVAFRVPEKERTIMHFEKCLPQIIEGSRRIADYAATYNITTTIENHGMVVQHSDRVQRVIEEVNRENFKTTLDVGNFLCVDEDPIIGVKKNLPYATLIHMKDFYVRPFDEDPGEGKWFQTANGNFLRGAIVGHGDLDMRKIIRLIKTSGYDGYITVEFEGMEDCREGSQIGMNHVKRLWNDIQVG